MDSLKQWRFAGVLTLTILGFLLHYLYTWTGASKIIGLFVPVNESVWEHLKLGYWSVVLFSVIEYFQVSYRVNNYYLAKLVGVLAMEIAIIIIYFSCAYFTGKDIFLLHISSYIISAIICQYLTHLLFRMRSFSNLVNRISLAAGIAIGVFFGAVTYYPPHISLFKDNNNNTYGINKEKY